MAENLGNSCVKETSNDISQSNVIESNIPMILKPSNNDINKNIKRKSKGTIVPSRYLEQKNPAKQPLLEEFSESMEKLGKENNSTKKIMRSTSIGNLVDKPLKPLKRNTSSCSRNNEMQFSKRKSSKVSTPVKNSTNNLTTLDLSVIPKSLTTPDVSTNSIPLSEPPYSNDKEMKYGSDSLIAELAFARRLQSSYMLEKAKHDFQEEEKIAMSKIIALSKYVQDLSEQKHLHDLEQLQTMHEEKIINFIETQESLLPKCKEQLAKLEKPIKDLTTMIYNANCHFSFEGVYMPTNKSIFAEQLDEVLSESNDCLNLIDNFPDDFVNDVEKLSINFLEINSSTETQIENLNKATGKMIKSVPHLFNQIIEDIFKNNG